MAEATAMKVSKSEVEVRYAVVTGTGSLRKYLRAIEKANQVQDGDLDMMTELATTRSSSTCRLSRERGTLREASVPIACSCPDMGSDIAGESPSGQEQTLIPTPPSGPASNSSEGGCGQNRILRRNTQSDSLP